MSDENQQFLERKEAAQYLGITEQELNRLVGSGEVPCTITTPAKGMVKRFEFDLVDLKYYQIRHQKFQSA